MRHFFIVRHCRTEYNEAEIVQGACDSPLSQRGRRQADDVGNMLSNIHFDHVFTGNQGRHVETARRILRKNRCSSLQNPVMLAGLNEQDLGIFDHGRESDLYAHASRLYEEKNGLKEGSISIKELLMGHRMTMVELAGLFHDMDSSGKTESPEMVRERSVSSIKEICATTEEDSNNLVITSGGTLAILLNSLTKEEKDGCVMLHGDCAVLVENNMAFDKIARYRSYES